MVLLIRSTCDAQHVTLGELLHSSETQLSHTYFKRLSGRVGGVVQW